MTADLCDEVEQIQQELAELKARLDAFEAKSKATIEADHSTVLSELRRSVDAVQGTVQYLETGRSPLAGYLESAAAAFDEKAGQRALVQRHLDHMDGRFSQLHGAALGGLERVETIKKSCDDMHEELGLLRSRLATLTTRAHASLEQAHSTLTDKQTQVREAKESLASTQNELRTLEANMEKERDAKIALRVGRIASWTLSAVFPPMAAVAIGLEVTAAAFRRDRKRLQEQIDATTTRSSSLGSEVSTLERQHAALDSAVKTARSLMERAQALDASSDEVKTLVRERLVEYQGLKDSTDEFGAWTRDLMEQTTAVHALGPSVPLLKRTTNRIVDSLLAKEQGDVRALCGQLKRLT